jgi:molecular chaperone GrpE
MVCLMTPDPMPEIPTTPSLDPTGNPFATVTQAASSAFPSESAAAELPSPQMEETAAPVETLQARCEALEAEVLSLKDQNLRLVADYDNFKKRRMQELQEQRKYGAEPLLRELLPVLDNLQRANQSLKEDSPAKMLFQSLQLMDQQLKQALQQLGLKEMEAMGASFDPALHEAVGKVPTPSVAPEHVCHVQQLGYYLHDKVLRPAQVLVADAPAITAEAPVTS